MSLTYVLRVGSPPSPGSSACVDVIAEGRVTVDQVYALIAAITLEEAVGQGCSMLVDASAVTLPPRTSELKEMVGGLWPLGQRGLRRIAVVAVEADIAGAAAYAGRLAEREGFDMKVFADATSAREWLLKKPSRGTPRHR